MWKKRKHTCVFPPSGQSFKVYIIKTQKILWLYRRYFVAPKKILYSQSLINAYRIISIFFILFDSVDLDSRIAPSIGEKWFNFFSFLFLKQISLTRLYDKNRGTIWHKKEVFKWERTYTIYAYFLYLKIIFLVRQETSKFLIGCR